MGFKIDTTPIEGISGLSMQFDITDVLNSEFLDDVFVFKDLVHITGTVTNVEFGYLVQGRLTTKGEIPCSRCLDTVILEIDTGLEAIFAGNNEELENIENNSLQNRDDIVYNLTGDMIDLELLCVGAINLYLPFKPLCSEDCLGMCSICGANLNHEQCDCVHINSSPVWDTLASLRDKLPKKKE